MAHWPNTHTLGDEGVARPGIEPRTHTLADVIYEEHYFTSAYWMDNISKMSIKIECDNYEE